MVTGGQRSGKSIFAESLALSMSNKPVYLATARILDEEMKNRVEVHKERRGASWRTIEESKNLGPIYKELENQTVLIDCLTMLASNYLFDFQSKVDETFNALTSELDEFLKNDTANYIFVTNEIGLGGVSGNELSRKFTDLQGKVNQYISSKADEVYFVVSGIPMKIKG